MPLGDGTGPFGNGPGTGSGGGWCRGPRSGWRGSGGHGWRHRYRTTGLSGWQRAGWPGWQGGHDVPPAASESELLRRQAESLELELKRVRDRLEELGPDHPTNE